MDLRVRVDVPRLLLEQLSREDRATPGYPAFRVSAAADRAAELERPQVCELDTGSFAKFGFVREKCSMAYMYIYCRCWVVVVVVTYIPRR